MFATFYTRDCWTVNREYQGFEQNREKLYMLVPLEEDHIEVPVFLIGEMAKLLVNKGMDNLPDMMAVSLSSTAKKSRFSAFSSIIRDVLSEDYINTRLVRFEGKEGTEIHTYYATKSALFNEDFEPLMLCTWQLEKKKLPASSFHRFYYKKPIMRITPDFFTDKYDNVGRFICKKLLTSLLDTRVIAPTASANGYLQSLTPYENYSPGIVIDKIPFQLKKVEAPSIATTHEGLLKLALDNINDID